MTHKMRTVENNFFRSNAILYIAVSRFSFYTHINVSYISLLSWKKNGQAVDDVNVNYSEKMFVVKHRFGLI